MKVLIETHGCKLNTADSQRLATEFVRSGYQLVPKGGVPDVFVLNSCTVTHVADKKARQSLRKFYDTGRMPHFSPTTMLWENYGIDLGGQVVPPLFFDVHRKVL